MLRRFALLSVGWFLAAPILGESMKPLLSLEARYEGATGEMVTHDVFVVTRQRRVLGQRATLGGAGTGWQGELVDVRVSRGAFRTFLQALENGRLTSLPCEIVPAPEFGAVRPAFGTVRLTAYSAEQAFQEVTVGLGHDPTPFPIDGLCHASIERLLAATNELLSRALDVARARPEPAQP